MGEIDRIIKAKHLEGWLLSRSTVMIAVDGSRQKLVESPIPFVYCTLRGGQLDTLRGSSSSFACMLLLDLDQEGLPTWPSWIFILSRILHFPVFSLTPSPMSIFQLVHLRNCTISSIDVISSIFLVMFFYIFHFVYFLPSSYFLWLGPSAIFQGLHFHLASFTGSFVFYLVHSRSSSTWSTSHVASCACLWYLSVFCGNLSCSVSMGR